MKARQFTPGRIDAVFDAPAIFLVRRGERGHEATCYANAVTHLLAAGIVSDTVVMENEGTFLSKLHFIRAKSPPETKTFFPAIFRFHSDGKYFSMSTNIYRGPDFRRVLRLTHRSPGAPDTSQ